MKSNRLLAISFGSIICAIKLVLPASAVQIKIDNYIKGVPSDIAICSSGNPSKRVCLYQYINTINEWTLVYTLGDPSDNSNPKIIDYMTQSSHPPFYFGVVRNFDRTGSSTLFRCVGLANPVQACQASPNPRFFPEDVPITFEANEVSAATVLATENRATGAPEMPIPGAVFINGTQFQSIAVNSMDVASCTQRVGDEIAIRVSSIHVTQYPFGGDIGNRDALIIDEEESASTEGVVAPNPTHLERYYYVSGYGRVKEGSSNYNLTTSRYDIFNTGASLRNVIVKPNPVPIPAVMCPQSPH